MPSSTLKVFTSNRSAEGARATARCGRYGFPRNMSFMAFSEGKARTGPALHGCLVPPKVPLQKRDGRPPGRLCLCRNCTVRIRLQTLFTAGSSSSITLITGNTALRRPCWPLVHRTTAWVIPVFPVFVFFKLTFNNSVLIPSVSMRNLCMRSSG